MTTIERPFGFNVIGHISGNLGLGVAARSVARAIVERGFPLAVHDLDDRGARGGRDATFDRFAVREVARLPYAVNLLVVGALTVRRLLEQHETLARHDGALNAAACFWELPTLPPRWLPHLDAMDIIVATSDFMRHAFQVALSGPTVIGGRLAVDLPDGVAPDRARFGLRADDVAFVTSFEPYSDPERKNTFGAIEAFRRGASNAPAARLVINVNNAIAEDGSEQPVVARLRAHCADDPRIVVRTGALDYAGVLSLYASCDAYVSLHRAEGLGLGMAESMLLGKPVIATGWSGNLTFMNHRNACLVGYRLVAVQGSSSVYDREQLEDMTMWADPDLDDAAAWIRRLLADADLRRSIGAAATIDMAAYNDEARRADYLDEIRAIRDARVALGTTRARRAHDALPEQLRIGRLARIQALERELAWIKTRPSYRLADGAKALLRRLRPRRDSVPGA